MKEEKIRTDLVLEQNTKELKVENRKEENNIIIVECTDSKNKYTTIYFQDITDQKEYHNLQKVLHQELKKYIEIRNNDKILVIGLGNSKSTPDSLGPLTIDHILVTRYLEEFGSIEEGYSNVCVYKPDVSGNTGIESTIIIKNIIKEMKPTKVIMIDSLKANDLNRLTKTIQITSKGINPGSGIYNDRGELSKNTLGVDVISIGIPTVVDIKTIIETTINKKIQLKNNFIVTPTNIDFVIERLSYLLGNTLNQTIHKNYLRQNKNEY